jgi:hypothetical protein
MEDALEHIQKLTAAQGRSKHSLLLSFDAHATAETI